MHRFAAMPETKAASEGGRRGENHSGVRFNAPRRSLNLEIREAVGELFQVDAFFERADSKGVDVLEYRSGLVSGICRFPHSVFLWGIGTLLEVEGGGRRDVTALVGRVCFVLFCVRLQEVRG